MNLHETFLLDAVVTQVCSLLGRLLGCVCVRLATSLLNAMTVQGLSDENGPYAS